MNRSGVERSETEYDILNLRYDLVSKIKKARKELNMTQEELALRIGTKKSNISRLESGNYNPTINFISKVAKGLGKEIYIELK